jgi:hypothetical protein
MSDTKWKGGRIGPYELGRRYPDISEDEGHLYEARHVETGEPALALMPAPGDDWHLRTAWEVLTTSCTQPCVLIVRPRSGGKDKPLPFHELALGYMRLAGTLAPLDEREDVRAHCSSKPRVPLRRRAVRWTLPATVAALTAALALLLWPRASSHLEMHGPSNDASLFSNGQEFFPGAIAYPMPEKPLNGQSTPPCVPELEVEIRGGCWIPHLKAAPCPPGAAEYQGKCYLPVKKTDPPPNSVKH